MNTDHIIDGIASRAPEHENAELHADGLLYCTVCGKPLQTHITNPKLKIDKILPVLCDCDKKRRETLEEQKRQEEIEHNRNLCFQNSGKSRLKDATFHTDLGYNAPQMKMARNYAANAHQAKEGGDDLRQGTGLLLTGPLGTGKTFMAAALTNKLIDMGFKCLWTNFADIETRIREDYDVKPMIMAELKRADFLILDDLGTERRSDYMTQLVFDVVDMRYRASKPMIVTTNLTGKEFSTETDLERSRIYDRIIDCCVPIVFDGKSIRRSSFKDHCKGEGEFLKNGNA